MSEVLVDPETGELLEPNDGADLPGDDDPDTASDRESGTEPEEAPDTEASAQAQAKALERELGRHERKMQEILAEGFEDMAPCATCHTMGFVHIAAPRRHPNAKVCDFCGGHGFLLTGSLAEAQAVFACEACQGRGYNMSAPPPEPAPTALAPRLVYVDPATGLEVAPPVAQPVPPAGEWAPGYAPIAQPAPGPYPGQ